MSQKNFKNVTLDIETYKRLQKYGHVPMSFNDVVIDLMDFRDKHQLLAAATTSLTNNNEAVGAAESNIVIKK